MKAVVPKIVGADVELSNFILGVTREQGTGALASRMLLAEIDGIDSGTAAAAEALDWGRKFLPSTAGCAYIDSDHLEVALAETFSAYDHVAYWRAMLNVVRSAARRVNQQLENSCRLQVLANCSDGLGNSYGSHLNVLVSRTCWNDIVSVKPHYLAYLAAFQISSIVFTGQGKVGSECDGLPADFQLSQRADFIKTIAHIDTMVNRGVVNTRNEPHCGWRRDAIMAELARLHVIFFDSTLCQVATLLRVGTMQMIAAMLEAGEVNVRLALDNPLEALSTWSRDVTLDLPVALVDGTPRTAVEMQLEFLEAANRFHARGGFTSVVPEADRLLALWEDTLMKLASRDFTGLSRRLDWVAKYRLLCGVLDRRPDLGWQSPAVKQLDQLYANLDEAEGVFWALERAGQVDRVVTDEAIEHAGCEPPPDTRAWTRAHLLRLAGADRIERVAWDRVSVRTPTPHSRFFRTRVIHLPLPYGSTRADNERFFTEGAPLESVVEALRATEPSPVVTTGPSLHGAWPLQPEENNNEHTRTSYRGTNRPHAHRNGGGTGKRHGSS